MLKLKKFTDNPLVSEQKASSFVFNATDFSLTSPKGISLNFGYTDITHLENINNFAVFTVKNKLGMKDKTPITFPIYSNAFDTINVHDFIELIKNRIDNSKLL